METDLAIDIVLFGVSPKMGVYDGLAGRAAGFEGGAAPVLDTKAEAPGDPFLDMQAMLLEMTKELRERFQLGDDRKGVVITEVAPGSAAADRGLRPGDLIVEVQQEQVSTPADVTERIERIRKQGRRSVLMLIEGQGGQRWVPLPLTEAGPQRQPG